MSLIWFKYQILSIIHSYLKQLSSYIQSFTTQSSTAAANVDTVRVESIGVCVVQSGICRKLRSRRVSVSQILGSRAVDGVGMSLLMENGGSLVLSVAGAGKSWQSREENGAVGDVRGGRDGVGKDVGRAARVLVVTVGGGGAGSASTVRRNSPETSNNSAGGSSGLEVVGNLGASAGGGGGSRGELAAVGKSSLDSSELGASARRLDSAAPSDGLGDLGGLSTINVHDELVGLVVESARKLSGSDLSEGQDTLGENIESATLVEGVQSSSLNSNLLGLSSGESDEVIRSKAGGKKSDLDTLERNLLA